MNAFIAPTPLLRHRLSAAGAHVGASCGVGSRDVRRACGPWVTAKRVRSRLRMSAEGGEGGENSTGEELLRAAMMGDLLAARDLLAAGAPAGYRSPGAGMTPLMWAASEGNVEMARLLVDALAKDDVDAKTDTGYTALLYAFENMPNANPRPPPPPGYPLDPARAGKKAPPQRGLAPRITGHSGVAKMLVMKGADLSCKNLFGENLLTLAARKGQLDWLDLLVHRGLSVQETCSGYKHTPIHVSAIEGHANCVRYLCSLPDAPVDAKNVVGWTALLWAAAMGSADCVESLLEAGADPNIVARGQNAADGRQTETSPLKEARKSKEPRKVAKLLLGAGARDY